MDKKNFSGQISVNGKTLTIFDITKLKEQNIGDIDRLPFSIKILVENLLRKLDGKVVTENDLKNIANWQKTYDAPVEIPYHPARVLMQDFTGVPAVVDIASMRDAVKALGGDPDIVNPLVPVELIVDHSVQVDYFGTIDALTKNVTKEYERNAERYELLKWAQNSFDNFKVVPPNSGICHQVNLEHLGRVIISDDSQNGTIAYPDTLVGTDSHTPMINGIGVMGWGVGGIEAEAVMLGQPYYMSIPEVIGVKLTGKLQMGVTATDLVLSITELLRKHKVVEKFVEYFGSGMKNLNIPDRATIANMTPEYGATLGFFPIDEKTIDYLLLTNRTAQAEVVKAYAQKTGLFYTGSNDPEYTKVIEFDLSSVKPCVAGPSRPQDRIEVTQLESAFKQILNARPGKKDQSAKSHPIQLFGKQTEITDGSVVIAAITSCTNTSNPYVLVGAGLLAKKAVEKGLHVPAYVKTSFAPGSKVVSQYMDNAGLTPYLEALGFHCTGYGCTTCIGNSGPLHTDIEKVIAEHDLNVAAVLSGNRNFEARIHQAIKSNFLMSPLLVVAFAIAGRIDIDLTTQPISCDPNGEPVYLKDIWPDSHLIDQIVSQHVSQDLYKNVYESIYDGDEFWSNLDVAHSTTFNWDKSSTYIKNPPYFENFEKNIDKPKNISDAAALLVLGDSVTTDHISPAGAIPEKYPAGQYLKSKNVTKEQFNSYGSRRGNDEVMIRGTFGNIRIKNKMVGEKEGSFTIKYPENEEMFVYEAATGYQRDGVDLIVLGGKEYGTGSSRDWAAKGTNLLGIKAVIAQSYERIHKSNLVGMGVLPLIFAPGDSWQSLGLDGSEKYTIEGIEQISPRKVLKVSAHKADGNTVTFNATARLDTEMDVDYFVNGGILPCVLRKILK